MLLDEVLAPLGETIAPTAATRAQLFYHGTKIKARADSIMRSGILPQDPTTVGHSTRGMMTPVAGQVYLTPHLRYAVIYAIGGNMLGHALGADRIADEPYGYLFVVPGDRLTALQPDEDEVGQAVRHAAAWRQTTQPPDTVHADNAPFEMALWHNKSLQSNLLSFAQHVLTPLQYRKLTAGWQYGIMAQAGKKMLRRMPDSMKHGLIAAGCHVSQSGGALPTQCWRIDKARSIDLKRDGSNFFQIAEQIWTGEPLQPAATWRATR